MDKELNKRIKKGIGEIKQIQMSPEEREAVFQNILSEIPAFRSSYRYFGFMHHYFLSASLVAVIMFAGVSLAAEWSLPGETLYAVKVDVTEPLRGLVKLSPEEKIVWEEEKSVRRLEEVQALVSEKKVDEEKIKKVEEKFSAHQEAWHSAVSAIATSSEEAVDISAKFKERMKKNFESIESINTNNAKSRMEEQREQVKISEEKVEKEKQKEREKNKREIRQENKNARDQEKIIREFIDKAEKEMEDD